MHVWECPSVNAGRADNRPTLRINVARRDTKISNVIDKGVEPFKT